MQSKIDLQQLVEVIGDAVIASDADGAITMWNPAAARIFGFTESEALGQSLDLISVLLDNPVEVGADRLVNGIAAWNLNKCKQVVIDFGTAITFDCLTEKCEYLGGTILPGIAISLEALANKTAQLPHIDISDPPPSIIGKSTVQAMKSGILYGYGGMIDGLVQGIRNEMTTSPEEEFKVVATGGMASLIAPYTTSIDLVEPMLTLYGLQIIYNRIVQR